MFLIKPFIGMFPLAMAVVDSENVANWEWFLNHLKAIVGTFRQITFISDRHVGLKNGIPKVFNDSFHAYCLFHLKKNFISALPKNFRKKTLALQLFMSCASAHTVDEYMEHYRDLGILAGETMNKFLESAPVEHWVNAFFPGRRYGVMTSNMAESYNSWIINERNLPITTMLDQIRVKVMKQMSDRREASRSWKNELCPSIEIKLKDKVTESSSWTVTKSADTVYEVREQKTYRVDLQTWHCGCSSWFVDGFPCSHAVLSILADNKNIYEYIDPCFLAVNYKSSYSHPIYPVPTSGLDANVLANVTEILAPDCNTQPGRPKKNRFDTNSSCTRKKRKCGRCKKYVYHNKKSCTDPIT